MSATAVRGGVSSGVGVWRGGELCTSNSKHGNGWKHTDASGVRTAQIGGTAFAGGVVAFCVAASLARKTLLSEGFGIRRYARPWVSCAVQQPLLLQPALAGLAALALAKFRL